MDSKNGVEIVRDAYKSTRNVELYNFGRNMEGNLEHWNIKNLNKNKQAKRKRGID